MKKLLLATFVALLMVGCGGGEDKEPDLSDKETLEKVLASAVTMGPDTFHHHNGLFCLTGSEEPYSGWVKENEIGMGRSLTKVDEGLAKRLKRWRDNGSPQIDIGFIGMEFGVGNLGELLDFRARHGRSTSWYENGKKAEGLYFDEGKLIAAVVWKPNGEKCSVANIVDGDGVLVEYTTDGTESGRTTYKDGEQVYD